MSFDKYLKSGRVDESSMKYTIEISWNDFHSKLGFDESQISEEFSDIAGEYLKYAYYKNKNLVDKKKEFASQIKKYVSYIKSSKNAPEAYIRLGKSLDDLAGYLTDEIEKSN